MTDDQKRQAAIYWQRGWSIWEIAVTLGVPAAEVREALGLPPE